jgi:hypothetical protein
MQFEMSRIGWLVARWNLALFVGVAALVYGIGGLDPFAALAG